MCIMQKVEVGMKSGAMECHGMERCLKKLLERGVEPDALVTDGHVQIASVMANLYPTIRHYYDCWHVIKGKTA